MTSGGDPRFAAMNAVLAQVADAVTRLRFQVVRVAQRTYRAEAVQAIAAAGRTPHLPFEFRSQCGEDLLIWDALGGQLDGFYIEVGAFDGRHMSVTYALDSMGWNGLLIEGIPERYEQCRVNRPNARVVHAALGPRGAKGTFDFTVVADEHGGMYSYGRANPQHLQFVDSQGLAKKKVSVPYTSMDELLKDHTGPIDVAVIDVEGAELDVLRGFDLAARRPRLLLIEDNTGGADASLTAHMSSFPYTHIGWVGPNRVYVRSDEPRVIERAKAFL